VKNITIIGSGGHSRSSINLLKNRFPNVQMNIIDDSYEKNHNEYIHDIKLTGNLKTIQPNNVVFLSVGDNLVRSQLFNLFYDRVLNENLFHHKSLVENNCLFGIANQVYANSYINSYCNIGNNNIINSGSVIEHEVTVGSHNYFSIGSKIAGRVTIGDNCFIGAGAIILENISICDNTTIGAGGVVTKNINQPGTYTGMPARILK
jgi:sugar O-acyltransferase (sialic acid O-acetyltransferase NeuD family)